MKKVIILASEHCLFSSVGGPMDMFLQAGMLWNGILGIIEKWNIANNQWDILFTTENDLDESYYREWEHFIDCINNNTKPLTTIDNGISVLEVVEAAKISSENDCTRVYLDNYK